MIGPGELKWVLVSLRLVTGPYVWVKTLLSQLSFSFPPESVDNCPSNCYGNGDCISGTCHCFLGFLGPDCGRGEMSAPHKGFQCHSRALRAAQAPCLRASAELQATSWPPQKGSPRLFFRRPERVVCRQSHGCTGRHYPHLRDAGGQGGWAFTGAATVHFMSSRQGSGSGVDFPLEK